MNFDKEEKYLIDVLENDNIKLTSPSSAEIESIKTAAKNTFKKNKRITIRLYEHDFTGIQKKAMEMGVPYQTLISSLIHRYVEGDLKLKTG